MIIKVTTKNVSLHIEAINGFDAIKKFFKMIKNNKIALNDLGLIGYWIRSDGEKIVFRIFPALYYAGIINYETYHYSLNQAGVWINKDQAEQTAYTDKWMITD